MTLAPLHRVKILGRELQVRSAAASERVRQVEDFVNAQLAEAEISAKTSDLQVIAILALLNIAELYLDVSANSAEFSRICSEKVGSLLKNIEDTLQ